MPAILMARAPAIGSTEYNDENNSYGILAFTGVFGVLALISVTLRLYVRKVMLKYVGANDIVMAIAMLFGVGIYICFIGESYHGLGRHYTALLPEDEVIYLKWSFYHSLIILVGLTLTKISICLLLLRLVIQKGYRYVLWGVIVLLSAYTIACGGTLIFSCIPVRAAWDLSLQGTAKCFSSRTFTALGVVNTSVNMFTDVLLALLPVPIVMRLQLNPRTKIALTGVLALGLIAVAAGAVKVSGQWTFLADKDRLYHDRFFVWAAIELYLGILAASLPTLKPLMAKFFTSARTAKSHISSSNNGSNKKKSWIIQKRDSLLGYNIKTDSATHLTTNSAPSKPERTKEFTNIIMRRSSIDVHTECTRSESLPLEGVTWLARQPHAMPSHRSLRDDTDKEEQFIVRTTMVTTTCEARDNMDSLEAFKPTHKTSVEALRDT